MIEYKNDLRIAAQLKKQTVELGELNAGEEGPLDKEIIKCASKFLKGKQRSAFFFAYHCVATWEDIQMLFKDKLNSELAEDTVKRYARDAATRIIDNLN